MYRSPLNCAQFLHCLNVPASSLLLYTASGNASGICPWACSPGYYIVQVLSLAFDLAFVDQLLAECMCAM